MRTYIPLNALRAFECAARHLSFTRAAAELCVTPTAISHQIRSLEEFLETTLFERKSGKLVLTPATASALQELSEGFNKLESALLTLNRRGGRQKITVAASPSVAALWLMPKLQRFFVDAPEIDVSISSVIAPGRLRRRRLRRVDLQFQRTSRPKGRVSDGRADLSGLLSRSPVGHGLERRGGAGRTASHPRRQGWRSVSDLAALFRGDTDADARRDLVACASTSRAWRSTPPSKATGSCWAGTG